MKLHRLIGIFLLALFLFNFPILSLFNSPKSGPASIFIYLFVAWGFCIGLAAWVLEKRPKDEF